MGLFGALNKMSGYSADNMNKVFDEFLPVMDSKAICPIGISLKAKGLFSSKPIASGFATITDTSLFVIYTMIPIKGVAIYDFRNTNCPENQRLSATGNALGTNACNLKAVFDRIKNRTASAPKKEQTLFCFHQKFAQYGTTTVSQVLLSSLMV